MLDLLREEVHRLHMELPKNNLVVWTSGNVSARDPETGYVVIKPSGVKYEALRPDHMVVVDVNGEVIEGAHKPSSDTASHLYIYRRRPDVNGVVHTHSPYATAFAALGRPIPVYLTAIADEFGGPVPCGDFALIGGEEIGQVVVDSIGDAPAVLLKNHGVFTIGATAEAALKAAVKVAYHSDGNIMPIIPDLIEIGLDVLNPIQPQSMDPVEVKAAFGDKLCFWVSIDEQHTLPFGSPAEVEREVITRLRTIGKKGGLIIGPTHRVQLDTPLPNFWAMVNTIKGAPYNALQR
jgi:L-ribulose-5-phosphate 4-epimerase